MEAGSKVKLKEAQFDVLREVVVWFLFLERRVAFQLGSFYYAFNPHSKTKDLFQTLLL